MNQYIVDIVLGFVQGVTELLPVSSSGHLILFSKVMDTDSSLFYVVLLHGATLLAIMIGYRKLLLELLTQPKHWVAVAIRLVIVTIPVGILGVVASDLFNHFDSAPIFIGANLLFWGVVMIIAEYFADKKAVVDEVDKELDIVSITKIPLWKTVLIGIGQALSLLPGTSRSGITTLTGMSTGLTKQNSLDFAFFAGIPAIGGAFAYKMYDYFSSADVSGKSETLELSHLLGAFTALLFGYIFLEVLRKFKKQKFFTFFGIYRIILGIIVIAVFA